MQTPLFDLLTEAFQKELEHLDALIVQLYHEIYYEKEPKQHCRHLRFSTLRLLSRVTWQRETYVLHRRSPLQ